MQRAQGAESRRDQLLCARRCVSPSPKQLETTQRGVLSFVCVSKRRNKFREAKPLVQVHTAGGSEWWTKDASLGLSEVKSHTLSGSLKWKKGKGEESLY